MIAHLMDDVYFASFISIVLGLGLASLFRQACTGNECVILKGPSLREVQKNTYKIDEKCYTYKPEATLCQK